MISNPGHLCVECGKHFSRKDYLHRHQLNHLRIKPYQCKPCQVAFARSDLLSKHKRSKLHLKQCTGSGIAALAPANPARESRGPETRIRPGLPNFSSLGPVPTPPPQPGIILPGVLLLYRGRSFLDGSVNSPFAMEAAIGGNGGLIDNLLWLFSDATSEFGTSTVLNPVAEDWRQNETPTAFQNLDYEASQAWNRSIGGRTVKIEEKTRQTVFAIFPEVKELESISVERLDEYLALYWFNFSQTFPIVHRATFDPNTCDAYLLTSMLVIGMAHSVDDWEYKTLILLNKKYRRAIYNVVEGSTELPLELLQALIMHNFSAKNFGDSLLNKFAQVDHGANVMYLKFSGLLEEIQEPQVGNEFDDPDVLRSQWHRWIYYESCKRAVFFQFICDTQHTTFSKLELLSSFDIKFELPCSDEVWQSGEPVRFAREWLRQQRQLHMSMPTTARPELAPGKWPTFLWTLKSMMNELTELTRTYLVDCFSLYSRYILLHGLMRICWDMRGQGLLDLGVVTQRKLMDFYKKIERGFGDWKTQFDFHVRTYNEQVKNSSDTDSQAMNNYGPTNALWANISFYYTGLFCLYADISVIRKYAVEYVIGREPKMAQNRDSALIGQWARSPNGRPAALESAMFLRLVAGNEETVNTFSHVPGTAYVAALIIWAYETRREFAYNGPCEFRLYFDQYGAVNYDKASTNAESYFHLLSEPGKDDEIDRLGLNYSEICYGGSLAVVCYVLHLLRGCKWSYSVDLVRALEQIVKTYGNSQST